MSSIASSAISTKSSTGLVKRMIPFSWGIVKQLTTVAVTILALLAVTFFIGRIMPIDPVVAVVGDRATPEVYAQVRAQLGLDQPLWTQFSLYLKDIFNGDLGFSQSTGNPVFDDIKEFFPATLELATLGMIVGTLLGIPLGIFAALKRGQWQDNFIRVFSLIGYSTPVFWLGLIGLFIFYAQLDWVAGPGRLDIGYDFLVEPVTGLILIDSAMVGEWEVFFNAVAHLILPVTLLGYFSMAYIGRMTRSLMLDELEKEYVVTAKVKGVSTWNIITKHCLRNIRVPLITILALSYASLLEGAVLTETVFAWPGLGAYITSALFSADMPAVLGGTLVVGVCFVTLNLLAELAYPLLDPRVKR
ncbi:ABC transporter permease [Vibrio sp. SS-MA-C1-2]|uniref:ABC transporter permease n=1 Tax=Vibrio sp. SS-MA-C1-2 TaxID=2908646 RepID=UPI001F349597|nr:ABC transporter permease [Vibrio sp. SS-MA-C1-2]UJF17800.1 ABC transporter permease [Vibrio sp. SS-MA-C1-2]